MIPLNLQMIGRFGNCCFQYLHARAIAERDGLELRTPRWVGEKIFQIEPTAEPDYSGDYLHGYFQNQESAIYTRTQAREWFRFQPWVEELFDHLKPSPETIVAHRRVGDLIGYGYPTISLESYRSACFTYDLDESKMCFVAEDHPTFVLRTPLNILFLPDFYIMCKAKTLLRANSSFSWMAGTLTDGEVFSPVIDDLEGGEHLCKFVKGNHPKLCSLEGFTDIHLKP